MYIHYKLLQLVPSFNIKYPAHGLKFHTFLDPLLHHNYVLSFKCIVVEKSVLKSNADSLYGK